MSRLNLTLPVLRGVIGNYRTLDRIYRADNSLVSREELVAAGQLCSFTRGIFRQLPFMNTAGGLHQAQFIGENAANNLKAVNILLRSVPDFDPELGAVPVWQQLTATRGHNSDTERLISIFPQLEPVASKIAGLFSDSYAF